ncbi:MAG: hypothetical protein RLO21_18695, partial [Nitratireductor sp.]
ISDYLLLRVRDDAFVRDNPADREISMYSATRYREMAAADMLESSVRADGQYQTIPITVNLSSQDREILVDLCRPLDLDDGEKIVMAAVAYALRNFDMPPDTFSDLANIFFEEAYHLRIVDDIVGYGLGQRPFVPESRQDHWNLVRDATNIFEYIMLEHVLYEGRGTLASAYGVHLCRSRNVSEEGVEWFAKIARQETNHGATGFFWIERLGADFGQRIPEQSNALLRRFIEAECGDDAKGFRAKRLKFSAYLLNRYRSGASTPEIVNVIKNNVKHVMETGDVIISQDEMSAGVDALYKAVS